MRITYRLALVALTLIFSLAFTVHGMPDQDSAEDASTLSGRDDSGNYLIYPKDIYNQDQNKAVQTLLESLNPSRIYVSSSDNNTVTWFWSVTFTPEHAEKLRADPNVRMCSYFRSKGFGTDEYRSLELFNETPHTIMIR